MAAAFLVDYTPLIVEINEDIPEVVLSKLADETEVLELGAALRAIERTQQAWKREHVHSGYAHVW